MKDRTGQRIGRLTVVEQGPTIEEGRAKRPRKTWICRCDCGNTVTLRSNTVTSKKTKSCGCLADEVRRTNRFKPIETTCCICGKVFTHTRGPRAKTCNDECHRKRRLHYLSKLGRSDFVHTLKRAHKNIVRRSRVKQLECDVTPEYLIMLFNKQEGKCAMTNVPFELSKDPGVKGVSPWSIAVDQINPGRGYTRENIRLVCAIYNQAKHVWSDNDVLKLATSLVT
jgi:hypothetical protein